jgi:hypothetical protein
MFNFAISFFISTTVLGMDQFVIVFDTEKAFESAIDEHSLVLRVANSSPSDFQSFDHYSDKYIRRVVIKEIGGDITEARIVFRSSNIQCAVYSFKEPFRIVIDIYDDNEKALSSGAAIAALESPSDGQEPTFRRPDISRSDYESKWLSYPLFMYRLDHLPSMINKTDDSSVFKSAAEAFDKGNDALALKRYQSLIAKHAQELTDSPGHLWRYAEIHFGMGNYNFADGYFQVLARKYQGSPLAAFAELRRLDISSFHQINHMDLMLRLDQVAAQSNTSDFKAAVLMRRAFWQQNAALENSGTLPSISRAQALELLATVPQMKSERGQFTAGILGYISGPPYELKALTSFLDKFKGQATEPYRSQILQLFSGDFTARINDLSQKNANVEVISQFEALSSTLAEAITDRATIQKIADSYQKMARPERAAEIYAKLPSSSEAEELEALLKASISAIQSVFVRSIQNQTTDRYTALAAENDRRALELWNRLEAKAEFFEQHRQTLVSFAKETHLLRTPSLILLFAWQKSLTEGKVPDDSDLVQTILNIAEKFAKLGMSKEEQDSKALLRMVKPNTDQEKVLWSKAMAELAGKLRQENQYLEAGRTYAIAAEHDESQRVNHLYRGALLMARAGRRDEAIGLLERCSQDTSNLYYANLCNERLDRLRNRD